MRERPVADAALYRIAISGSRGNGDAEQERAAPRGAAPDPFTPTLSPQAGRGKAGDQVCQRKACCLRCEPWLSLMLTRPGPGVFINWLSASRTSFVSST